MCYLRFLLFFSLGYTAASRHSEPSEYTFARDDFSQPTAPEIEKQIRLLLEALQNEREERTKAVQREEEERRKAVQREEEERKKLLDRMIPANLPTRLLSDVNSSIAYIEVKYTDPVYGNGTNIRKTVRGSGVLLRFQDGTKIIGTARHLVAYVTSTEPEYTIRLGDMTWIPNEAHYFKDPTLGSSSLMGWLPIESQDFAFALTMYQGRVSSGRSPDGGCKKTGNW
jgi:hypothetical protein